MLKNITLRFNSKVLGFSKRNGISDSTLQFDIHSQLIIYCTFLTFTYLLKFKLIL